MAGGSADGERNEVALAGWRFCLLRFFRSFSNFRLPNEWNMWNHRAAHSGDLIGADGPQAHSHNRPDFIGIIWLTSTIACRCRWRWGGQGPIRINWEMERRQPITTQCQCFQCHQGPISCADSSATTPMLGADLFPGIMNVYESASNETWWEASGASGASGASPSLCWFLDFWFFPFGSGVWLSYEINMMAHVIHELQFKSDHWRLDVVYDHCSVVLRLRRRRRRGGTGWANKDGNKSQTQTNEWKHPAHDIIIPFIVIYELMWAVLLASFSHLESIKSFPWMHRWMDAGMHGWV